jgi:eukaryotic-like serine/threonine-protein kinase
MPKPKRGRAEDDQPTLAGGSAAVRTPGESSSADAGVPSDAPTLVDLGKIGSNSPPPPRLSPVQRRTTTPGEPESTPILEPQSVLGQRYEILELLGQGGMGAVYKARDREVNQLVALKVIRPDLASNPAIIERFKQELILARQVTHKNVIRIYDLAEADGVKFITMEYVEGEDLRSLIHETKKLAPAEAVEIMRQVCLALEAAHSVGVIHRDLKPQNIMRDKTGRVLVMDFGLARTIEGSGMTQSGAMVGTLEYMSPEQALGKSLDQRSDLFTVGLIFYELLTGKMPFSADSALASLIKRTQERAVPISDHDHSIPGALSGVVSKCLERDSNLRYQTAKELLADLEGWQGKTAGATLSFPSVGTWAQGAWPWIAVSLVALVLMFVGVRYRETLFPLKPLQQAVVVKPDVSLAILPFRNASGDPALDWLGNYVAEMLQTQVGQSARVRIISPERVHQVLADLRISPDTSIDPSTVRRVAESSSADTLVWGQYSKFGDQLRIDATVQDLKHDRSVPLKIEGLAQQEIPVAIDRLGASIRKNLSVSPDVLKELKASSFQPTSKSVEALRDYNQGVQLLREGRNLEAIKILQVAIKEDPLFALAYSRLADAHSTLGYDSDAEQASRKAVELSQKLPLAESYLIGATHARIVRDDKKAIQAYENLSKTLPDNPEVQYELGSLYRDQADYDKARAVFGQILQGDPKNIRALWQMGAIEMMSGNAQAALDPLTKGLSLAIQADNQEQKGLILLAMGSTYRLLNKPDEALRSFQESLEVNTKIGQKRGMAADLISMAQVQALSGKSDQALANYNRGLQIEREIGAKKEAGDTLLELGNLYLDRGQHEQALKMYKDSLQIQRDSGDETYQALCLNNIGSLYLNRADYQEALTYLQQALQLRQKLNVAPAIAETLHNLGIAYDNLGQDEEAMSDFIRALDLYRKADDKHGAASQSHSMALIFAHQARYGAALAAMQDALKLLRDAGDRGIELAQSLSDLGEFLAEAGRGDEAGKPLDEAQELARQLKNNSLQATILNARGDALFYTGNTRAAKAIYEQAVRAASHGGDADVILVSEINLAKVALVEGRPAALPSEFTRLVQRANSLGRRQLALESSIYLAQAMINNKDYTRARRQLEQSMGSSEKLGMRMQTAKIHYLLGTSLRLSGSSSEAPGHYREALRLLDEMKKEPGANQLLDRSDLHTIYAESTRWIDVTKN